MVTVITAELAADIVKPEVVKEVDALEEPRPKREALSARALGGPAGAAPAGQTEVEDVFSVQEEYNLRGAQPACQPTGEERRYDCRLAPGGGRLTGAL